MTGDVYLQQRRDAGRKGGQSLDRDLSRGGAESRGRSPVRRRDSTVGVGGRGRNPGLTRCAGGIVVGGLGPIPGVAGAMWSKPWTQK